jgi:hypothetical protein
MKIYSTFIFLSLLRPASSVKLTADEGSGAKPLFKNDDYMLVKIESKTMKKDQQSYASDDSRDKNYMKRKVFT